MTTPGRSPAKHDPGRDGRPFFAMSRVMEYVLLGSAVLVVTVVAFFWAAAIRRRPSQRRYKYHRANRDQPPPPPKPKRKRRAEPPRNPTLAETRGLPPLREPPATADQPYHY
jgi:hypothetical protein